MCHWSEWLLSFSKHFVSEEFIIRGVNVKWKQWLIPELQLLYSNKHMKLHVCNPQLILANVHISLRYHLPELRPPQCRHRSGGFWRGRHRRPSVLVFSEPSWPDPEKLLPAETEKDNYTSKHNPKFFNPASQQSNSCCFFILKVSIFKDLNSPCPHHFLFNGSINVSDKSDTVSTVPVMFHYFSISSLNFWRHPCCRPDNLSTPSPKHPSESFWIKIQLNFPSSH